MSTEAEVSSDKIAVASRTFSNHPLLRKELTQRYKNVTFNESGRVLNGDELIYFLKGHQKAIIALEKINEPILKSLPELRVISKYGVGLDMLDLNAMQEYGVKLGWTAGVNRKAVAELALTFALLLIRKVNESNRLLLQGGWKQIQGSLLSEKTVGIIGCGNVGKELVNLLQPFKCRILVHDIVDYADFYQKNQVHPTCLVDLLRESDIVSLHVPLTTSTRLLLNKERLLQMKKGGILINTARGGIVDENDLKEALKTRHLEVAAFDVFAEEPPVDRELIELPNFYGTTHIGGSSVEAILAMGQSAIYNLETAQAPIEFFKYI